MQEAQKDFSLLHPTQVLSHLRDTINDAKEKRIIQGLPPVFIRLFGDIDYDTQLRDIPEKFRSKVVILTTSDTPDEKIHELSSNWTIFRSETVSDEDARTNSSLLLNEGLRFARANNQQYAFFLSSGYQRHIGMFYSMFRTVRHNHPDQDGYYFILPETHSDLHLNSHNQMQTDNLDRFLLQGFPFETALFVSTTMPEFETNISAKGNLGRIDESVPLGGMEFLLTLFTQYKNAKDMGNAFSPNLLGITLPIPLRASQSLIDFYRSTQEIPHSVLDSLVIAPSLEVTPSSDKSLRRMATWRAAMDRLGLTENDIRDLFSNTRFEAGITNAFEFNERRSII